MSYSASSRSFENCFKFSYVCTNHNNIVFEHRRLDNVWFCEKRDRHGNTLGSMIRTNEQMRPIFNHMQCVAECDFLSLSTNADFSVHSV